MKKGTVLFLIVLFSFTFLSADMQGQSKGKVVRENNEVQFVVDNKPAIIQWYSTSMFRVRLAMPDGTFDVDDELMMLPQRHADVRFNLKTKRGGFEMTTSQIRVEVVQQPFTIKVFDSAGNLINSDYVASKQHSGYEGVAPYNKKVLMPGEHFFGFGERMDYMDQRGKKLFLNVGRGQGRPNATGAYNSTKANYSPIPFFMSTRGYGIFLHNAYPSEWDMGHTSNEFYSFSALAGELDYFFIYGPDFLSILEGYTSVTGRTPLMPHAAMGLHVGTYSGGTWGHWDLASQYYVVELARKLREKDIPADILHLDSTWRIFGRGSGTGGFTSEWRQPGFPEPAAMFDTLYQMGYHMVGLHIRSRLDNGDEKRLLDEGQAAGITYPIDGKPSVFPNFFEAKAVDWWWENGLKPLAKQGAMFTKTDEGSAFGRVELDMSLLNDEEKIFPKLHNLFPIVYARAPFEKFQEHNNMRGMNHTREGFAGIQRYPFVFAGDWPSRWEYFEPVIRGGLNIGMSGVGAWTHCMGGFEYAADPELYIRWSQFGMFSPIALVFGMEHPTYKEPWSYGEEILNIFRDYDKMRYRLIPYIYSSYYQMYKTGVPIMRAMVLHHPEDVNTYSIDDQYYFGDNMLICPVTVKDAAARLLYLPEGLWYDYFSGEKFEGKQHMVVLTPLDKMPIYVKAGSIIPMQPDMAYIGAIPATPITLDIYPGANGSFTLYEDDGTSLDYQKGKYAASAFKLVSEENKTEVVVGAPVGDFAISSREIILNIRSEASPASVTMVSAGKDQVLRNSGDTLSTLSWSYDAERKVILISGRQEQSGEVRYVVNY